MQGFHSSLMRKGHTAWRKAVGVGGRTPCALRLAHCAAVKARSRSTRFPEQNRIEWATVWCQVRGTRTVV